MTCISQSQYPSSLPLSLFPESLPTANAFIVNGIFAQVTVHKDRPRDRVSEKAYSIQSKAPIEL